MITEKTAARIAMAHQEITAAEELLAELEKTRASDGDLPDFRDVFGRRRGLQLGVPSGDNARRLFNVTPELARPIIAAHVANQKALIEALTLQALAEARGEAPSFPVRLS